MVGKRETTAKIATWLTALLDRPVIDLKGLKDEYDSEIHIPARPGSESDAVNGDLISALQR